MTNYEILTLVLILIAIVILLISGLVYWRDWRVKQKKAKLEKLFRQIEQKKLLLNILIKKEKKLTQEIDKLLTEAEALVEEFKKENSVRHGG